MAEADPAQRSIASNSMRVFAALGADLVTNDIVAVIELVKNSYDAFATTVDVRFGELDGSPYLEVVDDGIGMDRVPLAVLIEKTYHRDLSLEGLTGKGGSLGALYLLSPPAVVTSAPLE